MPKVLLITENLGWADMLTKQLNTLQGTLIHLNNLHEAPHKKSLTLAPDLVFVDYQQAHPKALAEARRLWPQAEIALVGTQPLAQVYADLQQLEILHYVGLPITDTHQLGLLLLQSLAKTKLRQEQERLQAQVLHETNHDKLTGLANGTFLHARLTRFLSMHGRDSEQCAILFLDIDRFKNVNDSMGHIEGDQLLIAIAERLKNSVRPSDLVARLGGDEFTILLEGITDQSDVRRAAERVQMGLSSPICLANQEVYVSASIGIAISRSEHDSADTLIQDADTAMYRAKERGGGVFEIFDTSMQTHAAHFLELENNLRRALTRDEFQLFYQPIVSLQTREIVGFEALLRWIRPDVGMISPVEFIPIAEQTGLIVPIGKWVLGQACRQLKQWEAYQPTSTPLFMSVNISPRQFSHSELVNDVALILQETAVSPEVLKLEVTESLLIDTVAQTMDTMTQLRAMNIRLCVDDFGTGYSSLSTLSQFPIQTLKIDRSFVKRLGPDGRHGAIIDTILNLAHTLGMDVIAEGIETLEQLEQLKIRNCEFGQGFLFARPVTATQATAMLEGTVLAPTPVETQSATRHDKDKSA